MKKVDLEKTSLDRCVLEAQGDRVIVLHDLGVTGELPIEEATEEAVLRLASSTPSVGA